MERLLSYFIFRELGKLVIPHLQKASPLLLKFQGTLFVTFLGHLCALSGCHDL